MFDSLSQLLNFIESPLLLISERTSLPSDQIKLLFILLSSIPIGLVHKFIKGPLLRNLYSFSFGFLFQVFLFKTGVFNTLINCVLLYIVMLISPRKKCGIIVFVISMITLSYIHIKRMIEDYGGWSMDVSVAFMMFTCKYSYLAFSYTDGEIEKLPNFLEFLGFIYFYPASIIGPTYNFIHYQNFIYLKGQYANLPSRLQATWQEFGIGLFFAGLTAVLGPMFPLDYIASAEYGERNFLMKILLLHVYTFVFRFKYYSGWKLTQAGINASGISFSGFDENNNSKFDLITTMDIYFEVEHNPRIKIELWNQSVQTWLKKCVYLRVYDNNPKRATIAMYATFLISAFWHGFYLAYYIAFLQFGLINNVTRYIFKAQYKFEPINGIILKTMRWIISTTVMNYIGATFLLLLNDKIWMFYLNFDLAVTLGLIITQVFFMITGWGQRSSSGERGIKKN